MTVSYQKPVKGVQLSSIIAFFPFSLKVGLNLKKWISNWCPVMAAILEEKWAQGMKDLDLDHGLLPLEIVLGVQ